MNKTEELVKKNLTEEEAIKYGDVSWSLGLFDGFVEEFKNNEYLSKMVDKENIEAIERAFMILKHYSTIGLESEIDKDNYLKLIDDFRKEGLI